MNSFQRLKNKSHIVWMLSPLLLEYFFWVLQQKNNLKHFYLYTVLESTDNNNIRGILLLMNESFQTFLFHNHSIIRDNVQSQYAFKFPVPVQRVSLHNKGYYEIH